jgi:hypothetical protein
MKKLIVFCLGVLLASSVFATVVGSKHDLSLNAWSGLEICVVCHTPHNATTPQIVPLWNHVASVGAPGWSPYVDTGDNTLNSAPGQPQGCSIACLSCHDGTVAVDAFGGAAAPSVMIGSFGTGSADITTVLTDDHPISFTYDGALATADGELHNPTSTASGLPAGGNIDADMLKGVGNDQLECCSCHDVHNTTCPTCPSLLVKLNAGAGFESDLCLTCHNK